MKEKGIKNSLKIAHVILKALPYIKKFRNKIFIIKLGGSIWSNENLKESIIEDISLLYMVGIKIVIVHGGKREIDVLLKKLSIKSLFKDGLRVTDAQSFNVVEMVLSGNINTQMTSLINTQGLKAIGISGRDGSFIKARFLNHEKYGFVGEITSIDISILKELINNDFIPVVSPIASDNNDSKRGYNINADTATCKIGSAILAEKVIFLSDVDGILDFDKKLIRKLNIDEADRLKNSECISQGMIPKLQACLDALKSGVKSVHIINGKIKHSLLLEIFTEVGIGTLIK